MIIRFADTSQSVAIIYILQWHMTRIRQQHLICQFFIFYYFFFSRNQLSSYCSLILVLRSSLSWNLFLFLTWILYINLKTLLLFVSVLFCFVWLYQSMKTCGQRLCLCDPCTILKLFLICSLTALSRYT